MVPATSAPMRWKRATHADGARETTDPISSACPYQPSGRALTDLEDGTVAAGPPPRGLTRYPVRVQGGSVQILAEAIPIG